MKNLFATAALIASLACAQNWPGFRGTNASGVAEGASKPPVSFDGKEAKNLLWKVEIPGLAHASPVVWGDKVFVATAVSSDPKAFRWGLFGDVEPSDDVAKHTWKVYCLDKKTGKILWEQVSHEGPPKTKRHPKSSQASSTPVTDGKHLAVFFGSEGLYLYDLNGKLLWTKDLGNLNAGWFYDPDYEWGMGSSPVIYKNLVIVQCDIQKNSFIAALDLATGKEVWRTKRDEIPSWGTPTIVEGPQGPELVANGTGAIRGYDPANGKLLWSLTAKNSEITTPTPIYGQGLVFVMAGYPPVQPIYAIKPGARGEIAPKEGQTKTDSIAWSMQRGGPYMPTPILIGELLYVLQNNGILAAYNAKSGERVYQNRVSPKTSAHSASPVAADGRLYLAAEDGDMFVVKAGPVFELLASNPVGEPLMATPAISGDTLIVRGQHHVFAFANPAP
jgi:outer membrane protein assembly factor BamB